MRDGDTCFQRKRKWSVCESSTRSIPSRTAAGVRALGSIMESYQVFFQPPSVSAPDRTPPCPGVQHNAERAALVRPPLRRRSKRQMVHCVGSTGAPSGFGKLSTGVGRFQLDSASVGLTRALVHAGIRDSARDHWFRPRSATRRDQPGWKRNQSAIR